MWCHVQLSRPLYVPCILLHSCNWSIPFHNFRSVWSVKMLSSWRAKRAYLHSCLNVWFTMIGTARALNSNVHDYKYAWNVWKSNCLLHLPKMCCIPSSSSYIMCFNIIIHKPTGYTRSGKECQKIRKPGIQSPAEAHIQIGEERSAWVRCHKSRGW